MNNFVFQIAASHVTANAIIHFGHACLSKVSRLPVHYVFPNFKFDANKFRQEFQNYFPNLNEELSIFYSTGFAYHLGKVLSTSACILMNTISYYDMERCIN